LLPHVGHIELNSTNLHHFAVILGVIDLEEVVDLIWRSPELFLKNSLHVFGFERMHGLESDLMNRLQQRVTL
jgi:hypothetical protein